MHTAKLRRKIGGAGDGLAPRTTSDSRQFPMISYVSGDLFESPAQTLVNTVNTVGAMGKGIALQFKRFFPEMFREYQQLCDEGKLKIGVLHIYRTPHKLIVNFPTKTDWRRPSQLEYIAAGLETFARVYQDAGIYSVAFPPLGCGNGELSWDDVRPLMEEFLSPLPIPIYLYPPLRRHEAPEHRTPETVKSWLRREPRVLPLDEVWGDLRMLLHRPREFATLTKQTPFIAEFIEDPEAPYIRVRAAGKTAAYSKADVRELWRDLRAHGVATSRSIDARQTAHLFPIFAALPYIRAIQIADSYEKFSFNRGWALQMAPGPTPDDQPSLALSL